jgi:hypothetical protein
MLGGGLTVYYIKYYITIQCIYTIKLCYILVVSDVLLYKIWGFNSDEDSSCGFLGCDTM